jgi:SAM-dependent methyltransferase
VSAPEPLATPRSPTPRRILGRLRGELGAALLDREPVARLRSELGAALRDRELVAIADALRGKVALEPGGPSAVFGRLGVTPVYSRLGALDILDYAEETIWSASSRAELTPRRQVIGEAGRLPQIADGSYDAVLASHVIEHIANPLGALAEWRRIVGPQGYVVLVVPHRDGTFDHRRPLTSIDHLLADAERESGEDDTTHLEEVLELHDLERDPGAPSREVFEQRVRGNLATRAMHHHVFASRTVVEMCAAAQLPVVRLRPVQPFHIACLARAGASPEEALAGPQLAEILARSPFPSDREPPQPA